MTCLSNSNNYPLQVMDGRHNTIQSVMKPIFYGNCSELQYATLRKQHIKTHILLHFLSQVCLVIAAIFRMKFRNFCMLRAQHHFFGQLVSNLNELLRFTFSHWTKAGVKRRPKTYTISLLRYGSS